MTVWRSPAELLEHGLTRSRLVLMNEAHDGWRRCIRTREAGRELVPVAHACGVRHLAMEALGPSLAEYANAQRALGEGSFGYLSQPEMREFVNAALGFGWTLHAYEADFASSPHDGPEHLTAVNWREDQQARNLGAVVAGLPEAAKVLGWCGNGHLFRRVLEPPGEEPAWTPMGSLVAGYCGVEPFAIDQTVTVAWDGKQPDWLPRYAAALKSHGGTAGVLAVDVPEELAFRGADADAYVLSLDNAMTDDSPP